MSGPWAKEEALAQAIRKAGATQSFDDWVDTCVSPRRLADVILASLPESWELIYWGDDPRQKAEDDGAAREQERLRAHLRDELPKWGAGPTYSDDGIHRWRCEYPDRYGPCDCFDQLLDGLVADFT